MRKPSQPVKPILSRVGGRVLIPHYQPTVTNATGGKVLKGNAWKSKFVPT